MADVRLTATNPEDSSVVPVACDASGRLLLEEQGQGPQGEQGPPGPKGEDGDPFSGNFADDVTFDGSATFAESVTSTPSSGSAFYAYNGGTSSENAILISNTSDGSGLKTYLKYDGSATFVGSLTAGTNGAESIVAKNNNGTLGNNATIYAANEGGGTVFLGGPDLVPANKTIAMFANGSATFVGNVKSGNFDTGDGSKVNPNGILQVRRDQANSVFFQGYNGGTAPGFIKCSIGNDGSATFAGNKAGFTAEGYLWCTTARGDTVMLDATSNGVGVWVDYSPTTRIDEIRDKLDANRGDTGEMPTDTP
jgi:hypothetical protein